MIYAERSDCVQYIILYTRITDNDRNFKHVATVIIIL